MGVKQSGKSTVGHILHAEHGFAILEPGQQVMSLLLDIDPYLWCDWCDTVHRTKEIYSNEGYEGFKRFPEGRRLLQELGTRIRERDPIFWVEQQRKVIEESDTSVVHTSVRFPNEAQLITGWSGQLWLIENDRVEDTAEHESETAWRDLAPTKIIKNNGTMSDLRDTVRSAIMELG